MRRTFPLLALIPLGLALGACGDDSDDAGGDPGGDEAAFCASAESLLRTDPSDEELERIRDGAPAEIADAVVLVIDYGRTVEDDGPDAAGSEFDLEAVEAALGELDDYLQDVCGLETSAVLDEEPAVDGDPGADEADQADEVDASAASSGGGVDGSAGGAQEVPDPAPVPDLTDPDEVELADACHRGDMSSCDELYLFTPLGSAGEDYGATCGGRLSPADATPGICEVTLG